MPFEETGFDASYVVAGSKYTFPLDRKSIIKDSVLLLKNVLIENITDPQASNRTVNERFVTPEWPDLPVTYPLITVEQTGFESEKVGMQSSNTLNNLSFEINVWSKNNSQKDSLTGSIFNVLEQKSELMSLSGLFDLRFVSMINLDETGPQGIHRKMMEVQYTWPSHTEVT